MAIYQLAVKYKIFKWFELNLNAYDLLKAFPPRKIIETQSSCMISGYRSEATINIVYQISIN